MTYSISGYLPPHAGQSAGIPPTDSEDNYSDDWGCLCGDESCPDCGTSCTWCGGEASEDCTDPLAGCGAGCTGEICPCRACYGSGLRAYQRVF